MIINKGKKKGVISFTHHGQGINMIITAKVNDNQDTFIRKNANKIHFDISNMSFYLSNFTPDNLPKNSTKTFRKITLSRALYINEHKKMPTTYTKSIPTSCKVN